MMDGETLDWIRCSMEEIGKGIEELKWQKYLTLLPDTFLRDEADPRSGILLSLSWLLTDLLDGNWEGFTPSKMAEILRDIADAIMNSAEPG